VICNLSSVFLHIFIFIEVTNIPRYTGNFHQQRQDSTSSLTLHRHHQQKEPDTCQRSYSNSHVEDDRSDQRLDHSDPDVVSEIDESFETVHVFGDQSDDLPYGEVSQVRGTQLECFSVHEGAESRSHFDPESSQQKEVVVLVHTFEQVEPDHDRRIETSVLFGHVGLTGREVRDEFAQSIRLSQSARNV
jgi:hypothetical protein